MSKTLFLLFLVLGLWIIIVRKKSTWGFNKSGYEGGVSKKGSTHSAGGAKF